MKRFHWPLQRLLEVTKQREAVLHGELLNLAQELAQCRGLILAAQAQVQRLLAEVGAYQDLVERIRLQELVLASVPVVERQVSGWKQQVAKLEQSRRETTVQLMAIRRKRQTLERLHERALGRYRQEQNRAEQVELDEAASVAFARRMAATGSMEQVGVN